MNLLNDGHGAIVFFTRYSTNFRAYTSAMVMGMPWMLPPRFVIMWRRSGS